MVLHSLKLCRSVSTLTKHVQFKLLQTSVRWTSLKMADTGAKKALVFLAPGTEEMEFTVSVDILRRAGLSVYVAGVKDTQAVKCRHGVKITPDIALSDVDSYGPYDAMVIPGGLAASNTMAASQTVGKILKKQEEKAGIIAAICAAPIVLKNHSIYVGRSLTSYPAVQEQMIESKNMYTFKTEDVVVDGPLITSRGPGTVIKFAFTIADKLVGKEKVVQIANEMLLKYE